MERANAGPCEIRGGELAKDNRLRRRERFEERGSKALW